MKNKILAIALSAVIAFALWLYVISVVSPESEDTFYDIPVSYQNDVLEERGLMIVSEKPTVTLRLKGNRSDLNELNADNITILVNLGAIQAPGTQMLGYNISFPGNIPSNAVVPVSQSPNILQLKVENKIKKSIPIELEYIGRVPEGYIDDRNNPVMDATTIEVSGPESAVANIHHASIAVDLSGRTESIIGEFTYTLCDAEGTPVDAEMVVTNKENVNLSVKIQRMKEIPVVLELVEGGGASSADCVVERSMDSIWVSGSESKLRDLNAVDLGSVDLAQLQKDTNVLIFDVNLPEGVTNITGESQVTVTITFPELGRKKISVTAENFQASGVAEGMEVNWITQTLEVEVRGPKDLVKRITDKDITVTVDFTGEELGGVSKTPKVIISKEFDGVGTVSVPTITANLQEAVSQEETTDATEG